MKSNRPPTRPASFNDTQFVEVVGPSVHSPGERAKPRHADRPRQVSEKKFQQFDEGGEAANEY